MTADMQNAAVFIYTADAFTYLTAYQGKFFFYTERRHITAVYQTPDFTENPWGTYRGPAYHDTVNTIPIKSFAGQFGSGNVAITD